ncbi:MAG: NADPH-dependent FMN reductase [Acidimicrobiales bacterium]
MATPQLRTSIVVGNPKPGSRTLTAAVTVADLLEPELGSEGRDVIDVATYGEALLDWGSAEVAAATETVAASRLIIVASPTFKATYTGLLKVFLDRYGNDALAGTVAVPLMTGAGLHHALAVEVHLRPLLVELGASVPTRGLYLPEASFDDVAGAAGPWLATAIPRLRRALAD